MWFFIGDEEILSVLDRVPRGLKSKFVETAIQEFLKSADPSVLELFGLSKETGERSTLSAKPKSADQSVLSSRLYNGITIK